MTSQKTKWICYNGIGIALFVALSFCVRFPVFENYYLCLGYFVMMAYCCFLGPASGALIGSLGVVLYCILTSGLRGMPGWALGNLVIGIAVGTACHFTKNAKKLTRIIVVSVITVVSTAVGILLVKSAIESALYAQPLMLRAAKNIYAFVADCVVLLAAFPVCIALEPVITKTIHTKKERKHAANSQEQQ